MAGTATFRFYEELNDFLPNPERKRDRWYRFEGSPSIKNAIEAQGIPHTEVDLILVNGDSVGFDYRLREGDRVSVYPVFESLDISTLTRLRPEPFREPRFVADANLGKLARRLRLLGFDTLYRNDLADAEIVEMAARDKRIVITRDRMLLHHSAVERGYWVRSDVPAEQAAEVVRRFDLKGRVRPLSRCARCNAPVVRVEKSEVLHCLPPETAHGHELFHRCMGCGQLYWDGAHSGRLTKMLEQMAGPDV